MPRKTRVDARLLGLLGLVLFISVWWLLSSFLNPLILPTPMDTFSALRGQGYFVADLSSTIIRALAATFLVMLFGVLTLRTFFYWPHVNSTSNWLLGFWRSVPPVVLLAPIFIIVAEREYLARIVLATVGSFPVLMANIVAGLRAIPPSRIETIRLFSQNDRRAIYKHVISKEMLAHMVVGLRIVFCLLLDHNRGLGNGLGD